MTLATIGNSDSPSSLTGFQEASAWAATARSRRLWAMARVHASARVGARVSHHGHGAFGGSNAEGALWAPAVGFPPAPLTSIHRRWNTARASAAQRGLRSSWRSLCGPLVGVSG